MLQFIRNRAQGWFAWVIVGLITIPFALFGLNQYVGGGAEINAATVNGTEISQQELQNAYYRQRQRLQEMFGEQLPANLFSEDRMKAQILQQLIDDELIAQAASSAKMRVGDQLLVAMIQTFEAFQKDGKFSRENYEQVLRMQGLPPGQFEEMLRRDLILQQYRNGLKGTEFTTSYEESLLDQLERQQRDVGYTIIDLDRFKGNVSLTDEEIEGYYSSNQQNYLTPERVAIEYVELKQQSLAANIVVSDEEAQLRYESQKQNYKTPEERRASHILLEILDDAEADAVKAKAQELLDRINAGADFSEVARENSQDPGSAEQGGDLGFFGRDVMDKAFEDSVYSMQKGEISGLVQSEFGIHIIRMDDMRGGDSKTYNEVREEIISEIRQQQVEQIFFDRAEELANATYEHPDTLQVAADVLELEIKKAGPFSQTEGSNPTLSHPKVITAAFSDDVKLNSNNSEVIEISESHLLVLRVTEYHSEGVKSFEDVREAIVTTLTHNRTKEMAVALAEKLRESLKADGSSAAELMHSHQLEWTEKQAVKRQDSSVDSALLKPIFKLAQSTSQVVLAPDVVTLADGRVALMQLKNISLAEPVVDQEPKLDSGYADVSYRALLQRLRAESDIEILE